MAVDIRHVTTLLEVFDMPTSLAFYCEVLGFKIVMDDGKPVPNNDWVCLESNNVYVMLNTAYEREHRPPQPDSKRIAAHHDICLYFGCPDPDAAYEYLLAKGVKLKPPSTAPYGMRQLYLTDPDNYNLCFQWRAEQLPSKSANSQSGA